MDNGTGRVRGIWLQENLAIAPIFRTWFQSVRDLDVPGTVAPRSVIGSDYASFDEVGIPAFQFMQDRLEYNSRTHHSNMDTVDHIQREDLVQGAIVVATFAYNTAMRPEKLPRKAGPYNPRVTSLHDSDWVVYAKAPFGGPDRVLDYLGRYTHRVAISNNRLVELKDGQVSFAYKDYKHEQRHKVMTVSADEFLRRLLLHVLPDSFQRIRHYGLLGNRHRAENLTRCRELLAMPASIPEPRRDYRERLQQLGGNDPLLCPECNSGKMVRIALLPAGGLTQKCDSS
jgi:hypothetical protein